MVIPPIEQIDKEIHLEQFRVAIEDAKAAGIVVLLGLSDFFHDSSPWLPRGWNGLAARAPFFAARTDPNQVVLAPVNESAFPDTASWLPVRDRLLSVVRRAAPRDTLMWGGREW